MRASLTVRHWRMASAITADYTDELNDFDLRRLEALRLA
jgi:hypothetical protein